MWNPLAISCLIHSVDDRFSWRPIESATPACDIEAERHSNTVNNMTFINLIRAAKLRKKLLWDYGIISKKFSWNSLYFSSKDHLLTAGSFITPFAGFINRNISTHSFFRITKAVYAMQYTGIAINCNNTNAGMPNKNIRQVTIYKMLTRLDNIIKRDTIENILNDNV